MYYVLTNLPYHHAQHVFLLDPDPFGEDVYTFLIFPQNHVNFSVMTMLKKTMNPAPLNLVGTYITGNPLHHEALEKWRIKFLKILLHCSQHW